jgi:hypothetical protein
MPITPFLARQAFDPEVIRVMSTAFTGVCGAMGLNVGDDPATRIVAEKIIELAQRGVRDAATLQSMTLKEFDLRPE